MCTCNPENLSPSKEKKYRLSDFFRQWWYSYLQSPKEPITEEQFKAVNMMLLCRTAALGKDIYMCPDCKSTIEVYHSCKNRFCPTCSWHDTVRWAEKLNNRMLKTKHRHVVMTIPHQLNSLIKQNQKLLLDILFQSSAETIKDWMLAKHQVTPGIISVLHTFGEQKNYHPHIHMIVSWGGIESEVNLKELKGDFVNYDFIKQKFRIKFEKGLIQAYESKQLKHDFKSKLSFLRFIKQINDKRWIVHMEPCMDDPAAVVRYIGRYSKRACLSEYKITKMEGEKIAFRYKDYKTLDVNKKPVERELSLHYQDFFPLLLQHVPLKRFRLVRYYGVYSNNGTVPEQFRNEKQLKSPDKWEEIQEQSTGENPIICTQCNKRREYQYTISKRRKERLGRIYIRKELVSQFEEFKETA